LAGVYPINVCEAEWIRSRAVWLHCTTSQAGPGSNPGVDTANQAVQPLGVGKLAAIIIRWMATAEGCDGEACGTPAICMMAGVRLMQPKAQTTARWFPAVREGVLEVAYAIKDTKYVQISFFITGQHTLDGVAWLSVSSQF
jgi:hypothetical protein